MKYLKRRLSLFEAAAREGLLGVCAWKRVKLLDDGGKKLRSFSNRRTARPPLGEQPECESKLQ